MKLLRLKYLYETSQQTITDVSAGVGEEEDAIILWKVSTEMKKK